jgi:circadian clock protein KaiC
MKSDRGRTAIVKAPAKAPTGIPGFDQITKGGLPRGRTTLVAGGPGCGKTIFALQFLVNGVQDHGESGLFVAFEEAPKRIAANAATFGWNLERPRRGKLLFMDARPKVDLVQCGDFDLCGLLAVLEVQIKTHGVRRIVFDALDIIVTLLSDAAAKQREIYRLHEWLMARDITALITAKTSGDEPSSIVQPFGFMQFMVDCSVILNHGVVLGVSQRYLRVQKYRGSGFDENEAPFVIGKGGMDVAVTRSMDLSDVKIGNSRVTSGVKRLDSMLGGGYYRGASVLITGFAGTAKTTLGGTFAEAACRRGERTVFVSFDSDGSEVIRNLASVGIRLQRYVKSGLLHMISARTITGSAEALLARVKALSREHRARCVVIDPVSRFAKSGNELTAHGVAERLIDWAKADGITLVCTSLLDEISDRTPGGAPLHISTMADTWIHLSYLVQAGERNRGISIMKSRGMAHSNQVRELVLSNKGVTLADIYTAEGAVLMGTLRWEKESAERVKSELAEIAGKLKHVRLNAEEAELQVRAKSLRTELIAKQVERTLLARTAGTRKDELSRTRVRRQELRGDHMAIPRRR